MPTKTKTPPKPKSTIVENLDGIAGHKAVQQIKEAFVSRETDGTMMLVEPFRIVPNPFQPRKHFDPDELNSLAESIKEHGVLQPITLRVSPDRWEVIEGQERKTGTVFYEVINQDWMHFDPRGVMYNDYKIPSSFPATSIGSILYKHFATREDAESTLPRFQIVAGERRWRAALLAGLDFIPAIVREVTDQEMAELAIIENDERADISPIERAASYRRLADDFKFSTDEIAQRVGRSRPAVANALRLLQLPEAVQEMVRSGALSEAHGRALVKYANFPEFSAELARLVIENAIPSSKLEKGLSSLEWSITSQLTKKKLMVGLAYGSSFDWKEVCKECPFNAFVKEGDYTGFCLNPAHFKELNNAAKAELEQKRAAELAASGAASTDGATPANDDWKARNDEWKKRAEENERLRQEERQRREELNTRAIATLDPARGFRLGVEVAENQSREDAEKAGEIFSRAVMVIAGLFAGDYDLGSDFTQALNRAGVAPDPDQWIELNATQSLEFLAKIDTSTLVLCMAEAVVLANGMGEPIEAQFLLGEPASTSEVAA